MVYPQQLQVDETCEEPSKQRRPREGEGPEVGQLFETDPKI